MYAMTDLRRCVNVNPIVLFGLSVLIVTTVIVDGAREEFPGLIEANRHREAATIIASLDLVKTFSNALTNDTGRVTSEKCLKQVAMLRQGFENGTSWAMEMIDASSKIPSGLLLGNRMDLGMYDECVAVDVVQDGQGIRGRHCMYNVIVDERRIELTETLSICVPSSCQPDDVRNVLNSLFQMIVARAPMKFSVTGVTCSRVDSREWTFGVIATIIGFSALILLLIGCTICDIFLTHSNDESESRRRLVVVRQLSLYRNAREILSTETSPKTLPALQGIRFISMCLVILAHAYLTNISAPVVNLTHMTKWVISLRSIYTMITPFAVDTFFTMSGFLASYLFLKRMSTGQSFNIISYYIHRYLRLTPAFVALYLVTMLILPRMGSGALWDSMTASEEDECRKSWWSMLLYVHNYVNRGCLIHTWSLAVEMQCFWISPFILYPLARKPRIGIVILTTCLVASIATPAIIGYNNRYTNALFSNVDLSETVRTVKYFYMDTHIRAAPWLIGVLLGYSVFNFKKPSSGATKWIGWILAVTAFSFCIFSKFKFYAPGYEYELAWETFYTLVARPSWSAAISWVIYACVKGFGGPISTILSLPIFLPLSRLSYPMYLVHYVIQMAKLKATRVPRYFSKFGLAEDFLSDFALSFIVALIFNLIVESPVSVMEKLVSKRDKSTTTESTKKNVRYENVNTNPDNPDLG